MFLFRVPDVEQLEQQENIEGLIKALRFRDSAFVRKRAARALGRVMGAAGAAKEVRAPAIDGLVAMLHDEDDTVCKVGAAVLAQIGDDRAVESLISRFRHGDRQEVRAAALDALRQIGDARAIMPLIAVFGDKDEAKWIRDRAVEALATIDQDFSRVAALPAVKPLVDTLLDDDDDLVCIGAAKALGKIGSTEAVEPLIDTLQDGTDQNWEVRAAAVEALGEIRDDRAVELLLTALQDEIPKVKLAAMRALGKIGDQRAVTPLLRILEVGNEDEQEAAAEALGRTGDRRAVEPLKALLWRAAAGRWDERVRWQKAAVTALGAIGDPESLDAVIGSLRYDSARREAVKALGKFKDVRAVDTLISVLLPSDAHASWAERVDACDALAEIGAAAVERLVDALGFALENGHHDVQLAARALGAAGDPRGVEVLVAMLRREEPVLRRVAADALGKIRDDRSVDALVTALSDKDRIVRERAGHALTILAWQPSNAEQRDLLAAATHEWRETTRAESVLTLRGVLVVDDDSRVDPNFNAVGVRLKSLKLKSALDGTGGIQVVSLRSAVRKIMKMYQGGLDPHQRPNRDLYHLVDFDDYVSCFSPSYGEIPSSGIDVYKVTVPLQIFGLTLSSKRRTRYMVVEKRDDRRATRS